ncbi:MAG: ATP-binding cassette domain-containing protein [Candidatus Desulfofervidus sp.]|nr:ATP-binding cassette domain-containing protein [Candidatus Desulfofervidus sp.]
MDCDCLLRVVDMAKIFGDGCPYCLELTDDEHNICPRCGSIVGCAEISFEIMPNEILGIVGESGSGKSTILKTLYFDLEPTKGAAYLNCYEGDIFKANSQDKRWLRNFKIGMVYQNPEPGLVMDITAGGNIAEKLLAAGWRDVGKIRERASGLLKRMEIPVVRMDEITRNFSGGMQQRVQIAKALANNPEILLLDELTTGLDVSVQARILDLIKEIQRELNIAILLVTHDLGVIRLMAERTIVMRNGRIVEYGLTDQILEDPQHEYTQLLVNSEV